MSSLRRHLLRLQLQPSGRRGGAELRERGGGFRAGRPQFLPLLDFYHNQTSLSLLELFVLAKYGEVSLLTDLDFGRGATSPKQPKAFIQTARPTCLRVLPRNDSCLLVPIGVPMCEVPRPQAT